MGDKIMTTEVPKYFNIDSFLPKELKFCFIPKLHVTMTPKYFAA